ncbi:MULTISPECIES: tRNA (adenosine(37)-N6)-threonylcarbamoyltransferase complex dimerization subunit type 1 TsaB [unclassified Aureimonas]|uniref:tRNA (adenosine(37)-N6)-threonylcarbamoyltransferase complex dimerization subunit type 1 TsaB n=1 Tax=unclassified Aureimonas TaxID=2615206 RepID=UPI000B294399|nr:MULTISPECIES: tRNA (adenosine(37)-N6)-threonylcarbamoyltransferase complex dimerization subunit type 1 TsaB [unclassified Aureimonas]
MLLAIDTAGSRCSACLFDPKTRQVLARADPDIGKGHAERLMDDVAGLLGEAGATYADLTRLAVVVGPGSFTGLRVGVAAVRGLSLALGLPALGVGTLEALAEPHRGGGLPVLAVLDAKRGEIYAALHDSDGTEILEPTALAPADLPGFLAGFEEGASLIVTGSGASIAADALAGRWPVRAMPEAYVDIAAVARIAASREPGAVPSPLYLRGADAKPPTRAAIERIAMDAPR